MADDEKKRRAVYTAEDEAMLLELVLPHSQVVNNHSTNAAQPHMKRQVNILDFSTFSTIIFHSFHILTHILYQKWEEIASSFNSQTKNGRKTVDSLMTKFKNLKATKKSKLSKDRREILKTGGGTADLSSSSNDVDAFNFRSMQIEGLGNTFDSDGIVNNPSVPASTVEQSQIVHEQQDHTIVILEPTGEPTTCAAILTTPNTGNKVMSRFAKPKTPKTPIESDPDIIRLRKRKAELEVAILENQLENTELEKEKVKVEIEKNKLKIAKIRYDLGLNDDQLIL